MLIPLKQKYLVNKGGSGGQYKSRTGNSDGRKKGSSIWAQLNESAKGRRSSSKQASRANKKQLQATKW